MFFHRKKQKKIIQVSSLKASQEFERDRESILSAHDKNTDKQVVTYLKRTLVFVKADLETLKSILPKRELSRKEYIKFLQENQTSVCNLVRDGLSGEQTIYLFSQIVPRIKRRYRKEVEDLLTSHQDLIRNLRETYKKLLLDAASKLEDDITRGLDTYEEAQTYYSIANILLLQQIIANDADWKSIKDEEVVPPLKLAVKQLQKYLKSNPLDVEALELLVSSYQILGRTTAMYEAKLELMKAEALSPSAQTTASLPDRSGLSFEKKCHNLLEAMGFITKSTALTNDGGVDIIATRNDPILSGKYIIQCKDWQANVGVKPVRELYGVIAAEEANKGILIASSRFTQNAIDFAKGKRIELIDGEQLTKLISLYQNEAK